MALQIDFWSDLNNPPTFWHGAQLRFAVRILAAVRIPVRIAVAVRIPVLLPVRIHGRRVVVVLVVVLVVAVIVDVFFIISILSSPRPHQCNIIIFSAPNMRVQQPLDEVRVMTVLYTTFSTSILNFYGTILQYYSDFQFSLKAQGNKLNDRQ